VQKVIISKHRPRRTGIDEEPVCSDAGMAIAFLFLPKKREKGFGFFLTPQGERSYSQEGQKQLQVKY
jgi:hypothetical protein